MEQEKSELIPLSTKAKQNALQSLYPSESGSQTEIFLNTDYFSYMSLCVLLCFDQQGIYCSIMIGADIW